MAVKYRCPECRRTFPWDPDYGLPTKCPLPNCNYTAEEIADNVIALPAILSASTRATDAVAKKTMDGASERALIAAQHTGESINEMNNLKLTDMTNDATVKPVANEVSTFMNQHRVGGFNGPVQTPTPVHPSQHVQTAMGMAAMAHVDPTTGFKHKEAHMGARSLGSLQKAIHGL